MCSVQSGVCSLNMVKQSAARLATILRVKKPQFIYFVSQAAGASQVDLGQGIAKSQLPKGYKPLAHSPSWHLRQIPLKATVLQGKISVKFGSMKKIPRYDCLLRMVAERRIN